jgi:hypothetical protein
MEIKQKKDQIIVVELDTDKDYICLVDVNKASLKSIKLAKPIKERKISIIPVTDVNNAIKFVEIPKEIKINIKDTKDTKDTEDTEDVRLSSEIMSKCLRNINNISNVSSNVYTDPFDLIIAYLKSIND